jgi:hypothetical protein
LSRSHISYLIAYTLDQAKELANWVDATGKNLTTIGSTRTASRSPEMGVGEISDDQR